MSSSTFLVINIANVGKENKKLINVFNEKVESKILNFLNDVNYFENFLITEEEFINGFINPMKEELEELDLNKNSNVIIKIHDFDMGGDIIEYSIGKKYNYLEDGISISINEEEFWKRRIYNNGRVYILFRNDYVAIFKSDVYPSSFYEFYEYTKEDYPNYKYQVSDSVAISNNYSF